LAGTQAAANLNANSEKYNPGFPFAGRYIGLFLHKLREICGFDAKKSGLYARCLPQAGDRQRFCGGETCAKSQIASHCGMNCCGAIGVPL